MNGSCLCKHVCRSTPSLCSEWRKAIRMQGEEGSSGQQPGPPGHHAPRAGEKSDSVGPPAPACPPPTSKPGPWISRWWLDNQKAQPRSPGAVGRPGVCGAWGRSLYPQGTHPPAHPLPPPRSVQPDRTLRPPSSGSPARHPRPFACCPLPSQVLPCQPAFHLLGLRTSFPELRNASSFTRPALLTPSYTSQALTRVCLN